MQSSTMSAPATFAWKRFLSRWGTPIVVGFIALIVISWGYATNPRVTEAILSSTIRQSTPLILGALCGLIGERSGVTNIGIEGQMLLTAFMGFLANVWTGNLFIAVLVAVLVGGLTGLVMAFMSVTLKINQIIGGTVLNILGLGITGYFYTAGLVTEGKLLPVNLGPLADLPLVGVVLFRNPPITYTASVLVVSVQYVLFFTKWGLRTRAVGEHPRAADTLGVNVFLVRYVNVIIGGAIAGLAGAFLTLEAVGSFERAMTNGRGFVALAVMIFGNWNPLGAWAAALLFGLASAAQTQLQFGGRIDIPHQFIGMLPYVLTIIVLAGFGGKSRPPAADGVPYDKE